MASLPTRLCARGGARAQKSGAADGARSRVLAAVAPWLLPLVLIGAWQLASRAGCPRAFCPSRGR